MPVLGRRHLLVVLCAVALAAKGCGDPASDSTTTAPATTTIAPPSTTTTIDGPQPFTSGALLEPGEYVTTLFEPTTVLYRIERKRLLRTVHDRLSTGFQNVLNDEIPNKEGLPYRGVAIHSVWHGLTPEEVLEELEEIDQIELGEATGIEVGGFPGRRIDAVVKNRVSLWAPATGGDAYDQTWWLQPGPLEFIILDTTAGTLLITIAADVGEWDDFIPVAEEILAGISFPELSTPTPIAAGAQPLPADGFLEPGEYFTTVFQPQVLYRLERKHILQPFQEEFATGLHSHRAFPGGGEFPYRGVAIHNHWSRLTFEEAEAELREFDSIEFGPTTPIVFAGFGGKEVEAFVTATTRLWPESGVAPGEATTSAWWLQSNQTMRFILLDTPAGPLLITIGAVEDWDDFLPRAEEILAGISFPDL